MKILPKINNIVLRELKNKVNICINESSKLSYEYTNNSDNDILKDLIEHKAYATMFLFLNENYKLKIDKSTFIKEEEIKDFYQDCQNLLQENVKVVTEKGPLLTSIKGYPIYEVENGILRGSGEKKIFESFKDNKEKIDEFTTGKWRIVLYKENDGDLIITFYDISQDESKFPGGQNVTTYDLEDMFDNKYGPSIENMRELRLYNDIPAWTVEYDDLQKIADWLKPYYNKALNEEGTQVSDIASKVDQDLGINKPKIVSTKINGLKENISLRGFLRNAEGQYERGNYILCLENNNYVAIHKSKLNEDDNAFKNISTIQNTIQSKTGCTVNIERNNNKVIIHIKGNGSQLSAVMPYGDELKKLLQSWGNTVEFDVNDNEFIYTAY